MMGFFVKMKKDKQVKKILNEIFNLANSLVNDEMTYNQLYHKLNIESTGALIKFLYEHCSSIQIDYIPAFEIYLILKIYIQNLKYNGYEEDLDYRMTISEIDEFLKFPKKYDEYNKIKSSYLEYGFSKDYSKHVFNFPRLNAQDDIFIDFIYEKLSVQYPNKYSKDDLIKIHNERFYQLYYLEKDVLIKEFNILLPNMNNKTIISNPLSNPLVIYSDIFEKKRIENTVNILFNQIENIYKKLDQQ